MLKPAETVLNLGSYNQVCDDGHRYPRGEHMAVCQETFRLLQSGSYAKDIAFINPVEPERFVGDQAFACKAGARRQPRETNGDKGAYSNSKAATKSRKT